jgi:tRNA threonylcarbamoyladenosine biosynthesis protein TsaE
MPEGWQRVIEGSVTLVDLPEVARELLKQGRNYTVWLLVGDMGSGKTTLAKQIVRETGVASLVTSPTFSIVNQYGEPGGTTIYHFDFYRVNNVVEALDLGFEEYLASGNLCLIEWSEKIKALLPDNFFEIRIQHHDSLSREIYFRKHDRKEKDGI